MNAEDLTRICLEPLEDLLMTHFHARGDDLPTLLASCAVQIPRDLSETLEELAGRARLLRSGSPDSAALLSFAFRCGQLHERLDALRLGRAIEQLGFVQGDVLLTEDVGKADLDALARFAAARDRILKTIADYTLKFLVVSTVLLLAGVSLGVV